MRLNKNPKWYRLSPELDRAQIESRLQELVTRSLNALAELNLITLDGDEVRPLEGARLMARHYIAFETMKNFATTSGNEDLSELLKVVCSSKELSDIQLRRNEKTTLNLLNKDKKKETIRFPFEEKVNDNVTKVSILAQAQLGCISIDDVKCPGLLREAARIVQLGQRLSRCLSELLWCSPDADKKHKEWFHYWSSLSDIKLDLSWISSNLTRFAIKFPTNLSK